MKKIILVVVALLIATPVYAGFKELARQEENKGQTKYDSLTIRENFFKELHKPMPLNVLV